MRIGYEQLTMRDQKNSQSCFSIIIPPYFKDQIVAWRGSSLLNSRMWPDILRDVCFDILCLRACLRGGGGPQVGEVTRFGG